VLIVYSVYSGIATNGSKGAESAQARGGVRSSPPLAPDLWLPCCLVALFCPHIHPPPSACFSAIELPTYVICFAYCSPLCLMSFNTSLFPCLIVENIQYYICPSKLSRKRFNTLEIASSPLYHWVLPPVPSLINFSVLLLRQKAPLNCHQAQIPRALKVKIKVPRPKR
jgi:hypothetical protein